MAFFVTAHRAAHHRPPRMSPYLHPTYSQPPCLFYATPPRTPPLLHPVCSPPRHVFSRRAAFSKQQPPNGATPSRPTDNNRLIPKRRPLRRITHPLILPAYRTPPAASRPSTSDNRACPFFLYSTAPPPKQPPDTARPIPPAHTSPQHPAHTKNNRGRHPFVSASAAIVLRNGGKNSPPIPAVMRSCS